MDSYTQDQANESISKSIEIPERIFPDQPYNTDALESEVPYSLDINHDDWNLILVNRENRLDSDLNIALETISKDYLATDSSNQFDSRAMPFLLNMMDDAHSEDVGIYVTSAYRDYDYQVGLFNRKVDEFVYNGYNQNDAEYEASQYVALPGTSEHVTGLAVDFVSKNWFDLHNDLTEDFENTKEFQWLINNAHEYGFILRYPEEKVDITQITYEPWHFRYVGMEHAEEISKRGITLEEYLELG